MNSRGPRYPLADAIEQLDRRRPATDRLDHNESPAQRLAIAAGFSPRSATRWAATGELTEEVADRVAIVALGMHPACVWPEWFETRELVPHGDEE